MEETLRGAHSLRSVCCHSSPEPLLPALPQSSLRRTLPHCRPEAVSLAIVCFLAFRLSALRLSCSSSCGVFLRFGLEQLPVTIASTPGIVLEARGTNVLISMRSKAPAGPHRSRAVSSVASSDRLRPPAELYPKRLQQGTPAPASPSLRLALFTVCGQGLAPCEAQQANVSASKVAAV